MWAKNSFTRLDTKHVANKLTYYLFRHNILNRFYAIYVSGANLFFEYDFRCKVLLSNKLNKLCTKILSVFSLRKYSVFIAEALFICICFAWMACLFNVISINTVSYVYSCPPTIFNANNGTTTAPTQWCCASENDVRITPKKICWENKYMKTKKKHHQASDERECTLCLGQAVKIRQTNLIAVCVCFCACLYLKNRMFDIVMIAGHRPRAVIYA